MQRGWPPDGVLNAVLVADAPEAAELTEAVARSVSSDVTVPLALALAAAAADEVLRVVGVDVLTALEAAEADNDCDVMMADSAAGFELLVSRIQVFCFVIDQCRKYLQVLSARPSRGLASTELPAASKTERDAFKLRLNCMMAVAKLFAGTMKERGRTTVH